MTKQDFKRVRHGGLAGEAPACDGCGDSERLPFSFSYAFQPIVDLNTRAIFAHEALVRGPQGEGAQTVLTQVNEANRYRFDQACRVKAVKLASVRVAVAVTMSPAQTSAASVMATDALPDASVVTSR